MSTTEIPESAEADTTATPGADGAKKGGRTGITFETIALLAFILAFAAALVAVFALSLAVRSIDEHRAIPEGGSSGGGSGALAVSLTEFKITPGPATIAAGGSLAVTNDGTTVHDLTVEGLATPELAAGESATLDVSSLSPGTYELYCQIAGHRDSGMETELTVEGASTEHVTAFGSSRRPSGRTASIVIQPLIPAPNSAPGSLVLLPSHRPAALFQAGLDGLHLFDELAPEVQPLLSDPALIDRSKQAAAGLVGVGAVVETAVLGEVDQVAERRFEPVIGGPQTDTADTGGVDQLCSVEQRDQLSCGGGVSPSTIGVPDLGGELNPMPSQRVDE